MDGEKRFCGTMIACGAICGVRWLAIVGDSGISTAAVCSWISFVRSGSPRRAPRCALTNRVDAEQQSSTDGTDVLRSDQLQTQPTVCKVPAA